MISLHTWLVIVVGTVLGCSCDALAAPDIRDYLANPQGLGARISPDGKRIAVITTIEGQSVILLWNMETNQRKPVLTFPDKDAQLTQLFWANDERLLFGVDVPYVASTGVRARSHLLYGMDADGDNLQHLGRKWFGRGDRSVTSRSGDEFWRVPIQFEDNLLSLLEDDPEHVLLQIQNPGKSGPGVYRLDVGSGRIKRVVRPQAQVYRWVADPNGVVRLGVGGYESKRWVVARVGADDDFEKVFEWTLFDDDGMYPLGFSPRPEIIYAVSSHESRRDTVYEFDIVQKSFGKKIFEHAHLDVGTSIRYDPLRKVATAFEYIGDRPEVHFIDSAAGRLQAALDKALPGRTNEITSYSANARRMVVESSSDASVPRVYYFDRDAGRMDELWAQYPKLEDAKLAKTRASSYKARDGLTIPSYLTIPAGAEAKQLAVVVMPHGGPTSRDYIHYQPDVQFLASRGYAVFQPNFRGSTGFGDAHTVAGYREWGLAMQDDITDGARWLIDQGIADPDRIAIYGASYGGYAALMGLAKEPGLFRCGASLAGVTDLIGLLNDDDWYARSEEHNRPMIGSTWSDRGKLKAVSPVHNADKIKVPVLVAHGEADSRVHVKQAKSFADAMKDAGNPVELLIFDDEIHGLRDEGYRLRFYEKLVAFLDRCTAPRQG